METLAMSERERWRLELFSRIREGKSTLRKASELLKLSQRQTKQNYGHDCADEGGTHETRIVASAISMPDLKR